MARKTLLLLGAGTVAATIAAAALLAQEAPGPEPERAPSQTEEGLSLMERGAQLFFRGLLTEMEPAIEEFRGLADEIEPALRELAQEMGPALKRLSELVDDFGNYEPPEILPNGDIIIRRKPDAPQLEAPGEIEI